MLPASPVYAGSGAAVAAHAWREVFCIAVRSPAPRGKTSSLVALQVQNVRGGATPNAKAVAPILPQARREWKQMVSSAIDKVQLQQARSDGDSAS